MTVSQVVTYTFEFAVLDVELRFEVGEVSLQLMVRVGRWAECMCGREFVEYALLIDKLGF